MISNFKNKYSLQDRIDEVNRTFVKYPDRIPIVVEKLNNSNAPLIDKNKYLVPYDLTIGQFMFVIRKRMKLPPEYGLYLYINGTIPPSSAIIRNIYEFYKDTDGFLYIFYSSENTFG
jgi:GABA(A) receptor-associated protein